MPLRLNIGSVPENRLMMFTGAEVAPVNGDPFGTAPPQDPNALHGMKDWRNPNPPPATGPQDPSSLNLGGGPPPNTRPVPPPGASPPEPSVHPDQSQFPSAVPVTGDPFGGGGQTQPAQAPQPAPPMSQEDRWKRANSRYVVGSGWDYGGTGAGTADTPDSRHIKPPDPNAPPEPVNPGWTGWWQALKPGGDEPTFTDNWWDAKGTPDPNGAGGMTLPQPSMADQITQAGTTPSPGGSPTAEQTKKMLDTAIENLKERLRNTPPDTGRVPNTGDGTFVGNPTPGVVPYDANSGDRFGGHASGSALARASLIPLTSEENARKHIAIYAADLNVPPDRFLYHDGQFKWVDLDGQVYSVSPTMEGGSWTKGTLDMVNRTAGTVLNHAGEIGVQAVGGLGGYIGGSGPAMRLAGGMAGAFVGAGAADVGRQIWGNYEANAAGYKRPPEFDKDGKEIPPRLGSDLLDIDPWNALGQALMNSGFEAFARMVPVLLNGMVPSGLFGTNVYRLNRQEIQDLAWLLEHDMKTGGHILKRAQAAHELGLHLTPADLLQTAEGMGMGAGYAEIHGRLLKSFESLEATLANRTGKQGAGAANWMKNYYNDRQRQIFPQAVERLLEKIAPTPTGQAAKSVKEGFTQFRTASEEIVEKLEGARLKAGRNAGWGDLFDQQIPARADTRFVRQQLQKDLSVAAGKTEEELKAVLKQLDDGAGNPVTNYEKLHNIRLDIRSRIAELGGTGRTAADKTAKTKLQEAETMLTRALRRDPRYAAGDDAFVAASGGLDEAKEGLFALLSENPLYQERLGGALAEAGPTKIAAVKKLFEDHGKADVFASHSRAYLEHSLNRAGEAGGTIGTDFFKQVAGTPKLREGLRELAPDAHTADLLEELVNAGYAMDARGGVKTLPPGIRATTARLAPNMKRGEIFESTTNPLGTGLKRVLDGIAFKNMRREWGSMKTAVNVTAPTGSVYQNMAQTSLPLAGLTGDALERALYAAAPQVNEYTKWIPRATPEWALKLALPYLTSPPEIQATAKDLQRPGLGGVMDRMLGPGPGGTAPPAPPPPPSGDEPGRALRLNITRPGG
jgi:hypothetical protein